mmetsp:Transcript_66051/g.103116  ORF Transcript_66051/g.103116 Transcript_66051/m.103116 type:complete len:80 (+) Transcript_66051:502-741(+)
MRIAIGNAGAAMGMEEAKKAASCKFCMSILTPFQEADASHQDCRRNLLQKGCGGRLVNGPRIRIILPLWCLLFIASCAL